MILRLLGQLSIQNIQSEYFNRLLGSINSVIGGHCDTGLGRSGIGAMDIFQENVDLLPPSGGGLC